MRIDAHLHFWQPSCGFDNKPVADHAAYRRDFLPADVAPDLDECDIDGVILVQTAPQVEETEWLLDIAKRDARILGVTGWVELARADVDFGPLIEQPAVVGIRAQLRRVPDAAFVTRPEVVRNLAAALHAGLALTILAEHRHHAHLAAVLDALPPGPITLNHLGMPFPEVDRREWREGMRRFARRPQTYVQLSGLPFLFGARWRDADARSVLGDTLDIFGADRLLFASDWPMLLRFATYGEWAQAAEAFLRERGLTDAEVAAVFGGNATRAHPRLRVTMPRMREA